MQGNAEIASNDLLIGEGGNDTLRSHRGDDILIGAQGRDRMEGGEGRDTYVVDAGDTVMDSDGVGEVRWGGVALTGGMRDEGQAENTYRSEDGRFSYVLENNHLTVTDGLAADHARRDPVVIENFQNGQLGITLDGRGRETAPQAGASYQDRPGPARELFNDHYVGGVHAALVAGDSQALDRLAIELARSPEGQHMAQVGDRMLAQQQSVEHQLQEQRELPMRQGPAMAM
ncbi:hypothetical protein C0063_07915 [Pseudoxanthomonas sp. KAs_5_3]|nr:hypothetical protein C0063_07915 [Pseudoxanthomonas sp. KAs_5_3]